MIARAKLARIMPQSWPPSSTPHSCPPRQGSIRRRHSRAHHIASPRSTVACIPPSLSPRAPAGCVRVKRRHCTRGIWPNVGHRRARALYGSCSCTPPPEAGEGGKAGRGIGRAAHAAPPGARGQRSASTLQTWKLPSTVAACLRRANIFSQPKKGVLN